MKTTRESPEFLLTHQCSDVCDQLDKEFCKVLLSEDANVSVRVLDGMDEDSMKAFVDKMDKVVSGYLDTITELVDKASDYLLDFNKRTQSDYFMQYPFERGFFRMMYAVNDCIKFYNRHIRKKPEDIEGHAILLISACNKLTNAAEFFGKWAQVQNNRDEEK